VQHLWARTDKTLHYQLRRAGVAMRAAWWELRRTPADSPVMILGCSRAGTTLGRVIN